MGALSEFRITHPDAGVRAVLEALDLGVSVAEGPASLVAVVETAGGPVEIS